MGIFDFFKKRKVSLEKPIAERSKPVEKKLEKSVEDQIEEPVESSKDGVYELAYASMKYKELNKDYSKYKTALSNFEYDDSKIVFNTIGIILNYYYASEKQDALKLYHELDRDYPGNQDVTWLFIEVICTINIENDQEFVKKYLNHKAKHHDFNHHYQTEYQKGLELKGQNYLKEAIELWTSLNKIHEFSWNYYQIGILQYKTGDKNYMSNLKKGIDMDPEIKEDAKSYFELEELRSNPEFLKILE